VRIYHVRVHRMTVQTWLTMHALLISTLARRRQALFSETQDRLRGLLSKALDNRHFQYLL
jgi:hypothetical protein